MREWATSEKLDKILKKLSKKDKVRYEAILKKIDEVINSEDINRYKNLCGDMKDFKRVHIDSHFVLIFKFEEENNLIKFIDFNHHDYAYVTGKKRKEKYGN